jgi:single-stranded DNA-binding protein
MHTQQSLSGFIASEPQLTFTRTGEARFYATVGQEHYERNQDGSFTQLDTTFHNLVIYRRSAELAFEAFQKGDKFLAEGYVNTYEYEVDGQSVPGEEFIAKRLGHDVARHRYTVDRTRRPQAADATQVAGQEAIAGAATSAPADAAAVDAEPARAQQAGGQIGAARRTGLGRRLASFAGRPGGAAANESIGM